MSDLRGEERLVTVVFADMTESVRRTSGLTAEEATTLVNPLLETMVELMIRYGGRIDRFLGDGVLAVFGVPTAHEDDPFRAVRAALELRDRAADLGLAVTSGVNTGRVYFGPVGSTLHEELTVMGPTVNLAARFQGAASAGEIVVGSSTASHLAAAFDLEPVTLQIKGMSEPVDAFKATRLFDNPEKVRGIEGLRADLIGRDDELDHLRSAFPERRTVGLMGPAGVGKSRLAAEFRSHVSASGGAWLEGRCLELTEATGYAPLLDLFSRHLGVDQVTALESSLHSLVDDGVLGAVRAEDIAPFLARLLGDKLGDDRDLRVEESSAELRRTLTIDAIVEFLAAHSRRSPLVVFLEDVHWSDPLSRETITRLHTVDELMLLLAYRPDPHISSILDSSFTELALAELSRTESQRLVTTLLDISGIPDWLESQILDHGQGNPFYVEELIRSLIQRGAISRENGHWSVTSEDIEVDLPGSVEGVLMARFDRLGDRTRRAAKAASVLGRSFAKPLFADLAGRDLVPELATLTGAGILTAEDGGFSFVHALTRQAIYTNLLPSQRAELHERTAEILEKSPTSDVDQTAFHYGQSRNHPKAVEFALLAGERALASFTTEAARGFLERGLTRVEELDESDRPRWRGRFNARLGELLERMAQHGPARDALHAALAEIEPDPLVEARIWRYIGLSHRLEDEPDAAHLALDRAEEILAAAPDVPAVHQEWIRVQKERAFTLYFGGRGRELAAHNERVAPVVERYGTAAQVADHLYGQVLSSFVGVRFVVPESTVAMARRALELAESGADPGRVAEGRFVLGFSLLWGDQSEEAAAVLERAVEETTRVGAVTEGCRARAYLAIALRRLGRVDEAEAAAGEALEAARNIDSDYYAGHSLAVLCWAAWKRGTDCDELGEQAYEAWGPLERDDGSGLGCEFAWLAVWPRAASALAHNNLVEARDHLGLLLTPWERPMPEELHTAVVEAMSSTDAEPVAEAIEQARSHALL